MKNQGMRSLQSPNFERAVDEAFSRCLSLEGPERQACLEQIKRQDARLGEEVSLMLSLVPKADALFSSPDSWLTELVDAHEHDRSHESPHECGQLLGDYRIIEAIGSGGMGTVYRAERADGAYHQDVAIKLISAEKDNPESRRRFLFERQTLASLDHPNIARLLDGGISEHGYPFLVMEYVRGLPLDRFLRENNPPLHERLDLFEQIGSAMVVAHQKLIVHRDLKPNNILVTDSGVVKLLDFGIAKLLGDLVDEAQQITETGSRKMTLAYASPEQLRGEPISTTSDVFSLGVNLYQMLTGVHPFDAEQGNLAFLEKVFSDRDPQKPSTLPETDHPGKAETPTSIPRRELKGDLETVVLKSLRRDPRQRYQSVDQMLTDIRRYRQGFPVMARPDTRRYRARMFFKRHRFWLSAVVMLTLMLLGFSIWTVFQAQRLARERDKARQVSDFLIVLFDGADPWSTQGRHVTAREILDRGTRKLESRLPEHSDVTAAVMAAIGKVYYDLASLKESQRLLERALKIRQTILGPNHLDTAQIHHDLGQVLLALGDLPQAEPHILDAIRIRTRVLGAQAIGCLESRRNLGILLHMRGDFAAAEQVLRQVHQQWPHNESRDDPDFRAVLRNLASTLVELGHWDEAHSILNDLLTRVRAQDVQSTPETISVMSDLANLFRQKGQWDHSNDLRLEALELGRQVYGPQHPAVATSLAGLASLETDRGHLERSADLFLQALTMDRAFFAEAHPSLARDLNGLAVVREKQGRAGEAEKLYRDALEVYERVFSQDHPSVAVVLHNLGSVLTQTGNWREAEQFFRRSLQIKMAIYAPGNPSIASTQGNLAYALLLAGRYGEAHALYVAADASNMHALGADHPSTLAIRNGLAWTEFYLGHPDRAYALFAEVMEQRRLVLGPDHPDTGTTAHSLAWVCYVQGKTPKAIEWSLEAIRVRRLNFGENHPELAWTLNNLALMYSDHGAFEKAENTILLAYAMRLELLGPKHPHVLQSASNAAKIYAKWGVWPSAETWLRRCLDLARDQLGAHDLNVAALWCRLATAQAHQDEPDGARISCENACSIVAQLNNLPAGEDPDSDVRRMRLIDILETCPACEGQERLLEAMSPTDGH